MKREYLFLLAGIIMMTLLSLEAEAKDEFLSVGNKCLRSGDYACALLNYQKEVVQNPSGHALTNLAWVLATAPEEKYRDGKRALELAQQAVANAERENTLNENLGYLCALAAAYAENGDFVRAVAAMDRVIRQAKANEMRPEIMDIYNEYRQWFYNETPWRHR
ncbi:MAG: hypothetical protein K8S27_09650 [Candidatus Omnitrophica bacterium]|nr:hypothetical protein [Candidatus Omnitrophota bacterium]